MDLPLYQLWKFLHLVFIFGAISLAFGGGLVTLRVVRTGDVPTLRRLLPTWDRLGNVVAMPLFGLGIVFGFLTAWSGRINLLTPWLVLAYVLVVLVFVNGFVLYQPVINRLKGALESTQGNHATPEIARLTDSPRLFYAFAVEIVLWVALVFTMVFKPFI